MSHVPGFPFKFPVLVLLLPPARSEDVAIPGFFQHLEYAIMYISCSLLFLKVLGDQIFLNLAGLYWDVTLLDVLSNFLNSSVMAVLMHPI